MITRRQFVKSAAAAAAAPMIVPSSALGRGGRPAPSARLTLGCIGMGTMGYTNMRRFLGAAEVQIVALCDVDTNRREFCKKKVDEHYSKQAGADYKGASTHNDFMEIIGRKDIDAVVICTPDHWHMIPAIEAVKAGKDVYCEKPLTLTLHEAKTIIEAVRKYERVFQTGSQQRSDKEFHQACSYVRSGRIGKVQKVTVKVGQPSKPCDLPGEAPEPGLDWDRWLGPAPMREYNSILAPRGMHSHFPRWREYREYSGGYFTDWGAHHFDIAQWGLGMDESGPVEIVPPEDPNKWTGCRFVYANGVEMVHDGPDGVTFIGTEGEIFVNRGKISSKPDTILKEPLTEKDTVLFKSPGHHKNWLECIKSRQRPIADVEVGARSISVAHLGNLAYWNRVPLRWDPKAWTFVDGKGDAKWLDRERRGSYQLPKI